MTDVRRLPKNVLVLTKTARLGGAERVLMNALPYLDRERFYYRFAGLDDVGPLADAVRAAGFRFTRLPTTSPLAPRNYSALRRLVRSASVDLVHAHLPLTGCLARTALRGLVPVIYSEHNLQDSYHTASRWLNARTYRWQERVIAVSSEVGRNAAKRIGRSAEERLRVVPNGVDFDRLDREADARPNPPLGDDSGALRILVPGTLAKRKGQDILLDAIAELSATRDFAFEVWLAGDGPLQSELRRRCDLDTATFRSIRFLGRRSDVFALMKAADLIVLPSRYEGHPLALLEAMALGKACLATRVGGVPEIITSGRNGWLVAPKCPSEIAEALRQLGGDAALRRRLGAAAAQDVRRRFDIRVAVRAWEDVYEEVLCETALKAQPRFARRNSRSLDGALPTYPRTRAPGPAPTGRTSPRGSE